MTKPSLIRCLQLQWTSHLYIARSRTSRTKRHMRKDIVKRNRQRTVTKIKKGVGWQRKQRPQNWHAGRNPRLLCLTSHWMMKNCLKHFSCTSILKVPKLLHLLLIAKRKHCLPSKALSSIQQAIHFIPYRNRLLLRLPATSNFSPSHRCTGSLRSCTMLIVSWWAMRWGMRLWVWQT